MYNGYIATVRSDRELITEEPFTACEVGENVLSALV